MGAHQRLGGRPRRPPRGPSAPQFARPSGSKTHPNSGATRRGLRYSRASKTHGSCLRIGCRLRQSQGSRLRGASSRQAETWEGPVRSGAVRRFRPRNAITGTLRTHNATGSSQGGDSQAKGPHAFCGCTRLLRTLRDSSEVRKNRMSQNPLYFEAGTGFDYAPGAANG